MSKLTVARKGYHKNLYLFGGGSKTITSGMSNTSNTLGNNFSLDGWDKNLNSFTVSNFNTEPNIYEYQRQKYNQGLSFGNFNLKNPLEGSTTSTTTPTTTSSSAANNWKLAGLMAGKMASMIPAEEMTIGNRTYQRGLWDALDPTYYAADGRSSELGDKLSDWGVKLTQTGAGMGNGYVALAGAALKVAGSLDNYLAGTKTDEDELNTFNRSNAYKSMATNSMSLARNNEDLLAAANYMDSRRLQGDLVEGPGEEVGNTIDKVNKWATILAPFASRGVVKRVGNLFKKRYEQGVDKANELNEEYADKDNLYAAVQANALKEAAADIERRRLNSLLSQSFALGGPINQQANNNDMNIFDTGSNLKRAKKITDSYAKDKISYNPMLPIADEINHRLHGGDYTGGSFGGAGAGSTEFFIPTRDSIIKDTIYIPYRKTFNEAFKEAAANKQKEFFFNGRKYKVEFGDNPSNYEAGNRRAEEAIIPFVYDKHVRVPDREFAEGGVLQTNDMNIFDGGGWALLYPKQKITYTDGNKRLQEIRADKLENTLLPEGSQVILTVNALPGNINIVPTEFKPGFRGFQRRIVYGDIPEHNDTTFTVVNPNGVGLVDPRLGFNAGYYDFDPGDAPRITSNRNTTKIGFSTNGMSGEDMEKAFIENSNAMSDRFEDLGKAMEDKFYGTKSILGDTITPNQPIVPLDAGPVGPVYYEGNQHSYGGIVFPNKGYAEGGTLQTNGTDFTNGMSHINAGGTHEMNPYQGVEIGVDPQGVPNLVEEGEVVWNDYVFSNRLVVPKSDKAKKELLYEEKMLKPYWGKTFALAAKKIEEKTSAAENPNDSIAQRSCDTLLNILASMLEKEREKLKLQEMQDAIDQMTPEEYAILQLQMASLQQQLEQQLLAMQLQQLIPLGMEYMQLPAEGMLPMAALGGILNTPDNVFRYGGNLNDFIKEIDKYGLKEADFLDYLLKNPYKGHKLTEGLSEETFKRWVKDAAENYLYRAKQILKQYERKSKNIGLNVSKLKGEAKKQYENELYNAIAKGLSNPDYKVANDNEISLNSEDLSTSKNVQLDYSNKVVADYRKSLGLKEIKLNENNKIGWDNVSGYTPIKGSENEDFYNDINGENAKEKGVYNYRPGRLSSIDKNVELYGWKNNESDFDVDYGNKSPNEYSILESTNGTSKIDTSFTEDLVRNIEAKDAYKTQTDAVKNAITNAKGNINNLDQGIKNYLEYLDTNSAIKNKLLIYDNDGKVTGINDKAASLYDLRRNDGKYGIYHYQYTPSERGTGSRYFYRDKNNKVYIDLKNPEYVDRSTGSLFYADGTPDLKTIGVAQPIDIGNNTFYDYEVSPRTYLRTLTQTPDGKIYEVSNPEGLEILEQAPYEDEEIPGAQGETTWVKYPEDEESKDEVKAENDTTNPEFPEPSNWPIWAAGAASLLGLGYNALRPTDYQYADDLIDAAEKTGKYKPIDFNPIPGYVAWMPEDFYPYISSGQAIGNSTARYLNNKINPSKNAELLTNTQNIITGIGDTLNLVRKQDYDRMLANAQHNADISKFNSEGLLKADMANQEAAMRAGNTYLSALESANKMKMDMDNLKAAGITSSINGLINLANTYGLNKYNRDTWRWALENNIYPISGTSSAKGGKIKRVKKGLSF